MSVPTLLLTPLLVCVLLVATGHVLRMARGWLTSRAALKAESEVRTRIALEDEKERLLLALRDLEQEHAMGKLSDEDYTSLSHRFERRAVDIIERLGAS